MKILLWIWQLPQHLLGLLIIKLLGATYRNEINSDIPFYWWNRGQSKLFSGASLGQYIILPTTAEITVRHEYGHSKQSLMFGWLYLLVIGLPSLCNNLWDRWFHKEWTSYMRHKWYYSRYPEKWADKLGGVKRG